MNLLQAIKTLSEDGQVLVKGQSEKFNTMLVNILDGLQVEYNMFDLMTDRGISIRYELVIEETRTCGCCGEEMDEGFYVDAQYNGEYYCSETCLHTKYTKEEYQELYEEQRAYWTEWEV